MTPTKHLPYLQHTHKPCGPGMEWGNDSVDLCANYSSLKTESCILESALETRANAISGIRIVSSSLGILGAMSIIISALVRRRVLNSEVHPIFMISLADCMLGVLWIVGAVLWFIPHGTFNHVWCYALTLLTAILECVVVNLTVVYGMFAYFRINRTGFSRLLMDRTVKVGACSTTVMYSLSWLVPMVVVMVLFGAMIGPTCLLVNVESGSCWCFPSIVNVLPSAVDKNNNTHAFLREEAPFLLGLITSLAANYIFGFIFLVILYCKILKRIHDIKAIHVQRLNDRQNRYGATDPLTSVVQRHQSQARKRIVLFLSVFVISGFINLVIFIYLVFFLSFDYIGLHQNDRSVRMLVEVERDLLYAQSLTLPLQGFLNAIVYGWTRDDFIQEVVGTTQYKDVSNIPQFVRTDDDDDSNTTISSDSNIEDG